MAVFHPMQRTTPPRRRTAAWVGKPRIKLAERLDKKLAAMGYESQIEVSNIRPQQGAWRTDHRLDVMRVEGSLKVKIDGHWFNHTLESWSTITEMLKRDFDVEVGGFIVSLDARGPADDPDYERCAGCGGLTHQQEAACLHCGGTKEWANADVDQ